MPESLMYETSFGEKHFGLITKNGFPHLIGDNSKFQLGHPNRFYKSEVGKRAWTPVIEPKFLQVAAGDGFSLLLEADGTLHFVGLNSSYQATENIKKRYVTQAEIITGIPKFKAVQVLGKSIWAISQDGGLWAWGENKNDILGLDSAHMDVIKNPIQISGLSDVIKISVGTDSVGVLTKKSDGSKELYTWGSNKLNKIGHGVQNQRFYKTPTKVTLPIGFKLENLALGRNHMILGDYLTVTGVGTQYGYGDNTSGQITSTPSDVLFHENKMTVTNSLELHAFGDTSFFRIDNDYIVGGLGSENRLSRIIVINNPELNSFDISSHTNGLKILGGNDNHIILELDPLKTIYQLHLDTLKLNKMYGSTPMYIQHVIDDDYREPLKTKAPRFVPMGEFIIDTENREIYSTQRNEKYELYHLQNVEKLGSRYYQSKDGLVYTYELPDMNNSWISQMPPFVAVDDYGLGSNQAYGIDVTSNELYEVSNQYKPVDKALYVSADEGGVDKILIIGVDTKMYVMGSNYKGSLGLGQSNERISAMTEVPNHTNWKQVSTSYTNTAAVKDDGTLWMCGDNEFGQYGNNTLGQMFSNVFRQVGTDNDWEEVRVGGQLIVAKKQDGSLWWWGRNHKNGGTYIPTMINDLSGDRNFKAFAVGDGTCYVIKQDGTLWTRGLNRGGIGHDDFVDFYDQFNRVGTDSDWKNIRPYSTSALFVKRDGSVYYSGNPSQYGISLNHGNIFTKGVKPLMVKKVIEAYDRLNHASTLVNMKKVTENGLLSKVSISGKYDSIAVAGSHILALKSDSTLWAWGKNDHKQLGLSDPTTAALDRVPYPSPTRIPWSGWKRIKTTMNSNVAILNDNSMVTWGYGGDYTLGNGSIEDKEFPTSISGGVNVKWKDFATGYKHVVAIREDGTLWAWGMNDLHQIGQGVSGDTKPNYVLPTQIGNSNDWVRVFSGYNHSFAIKSDGTVWGWGSNIRSELGFTINTTPKVVKEPTLLQNITDVKEIHCGIQFSLAVKNDGSVWTWGANDQGQLGINTSSKNDIANPVRVNGMVNPIDVTVGEHHVTVILEDNSMWSWGGNSWGVLGLGEDAMARSSYMVNSPRKVRSLVKWRSVKSSAFNTVAIDINGSIYTCGSNNFGELGSGVSGGSRRSYFEKVNHGQNGWGPVETYDSDVMVDLSDSNLFKTDKYGKLEFKIKSEAIIVPGETVDYPEYVRARNIDVVNVYHMKDFEKYPYFIVEDTYGEFHYVDDHTGNSSNRNNSTAKPANMSVMWKDRVMMKHLEIRLDNSGRLTYVDFSLLPKGNGRPSTISNISEIVNVKYITINDPNKLRFTAGFVDGEKVFEAVPTDSVGIYTFKEVNEYNSGYDNVPMIKDIIPGSSMNLKVLNDLEIYSDVSATGKERMLVTQNKTFRVRDNGNLLPTLEEITPHKPNLAVTDVYTEENVSISGTQHDYKSVAMGLNSAFVIKKDGTLWSWGSNDFGQLGLGDTNSRDTPTKVDDATDWIRVAVGVSFAIALKSDGTLWSTGSNAYGQLGLGYDNTTIVTKFTKIGSDTNWKDIICGTDFTVATKSNGTLWSWGFNVDGSLGQGQDGTALRLRNSPTPVSGNITDWKEISCGNKHVIGVRSNGEIWGWGSNQSRQLSNLVAIGAHITTPTKLNSLAQWSSVACGWNYSLFLKNDKTVHGCGSTDSGQLGPSYDVSTTPYVEPISLLHSQSVWTAVNAHYYERQTFLTRNDGTVWACGNNGQGRLGTGINETVNIFKDFTPILRGLNDIEQVIPGAYSTLIVKKNGELFIAGYNIGITPIGMITTHKHDFIPVGKKGPKLRKLSRGNNSHMLGLSADNTLYGWGLNIMGQLGIGTKSTKEVQPVPIAHNTSQTWGDCATGKNFSAAINAQSQLFTWGENGYGQLGQGNQGNGTELLIPTTGGALAEKGWLKVACGDYHMVAIKQDGSIWVWGDNGFDQLGTNGGGRMTIPTKLNVTGEWIDIAVSGSSTLAIKKDGTLWGWGYNSSGELGLGHQNRVKIPTQVTIPSLTTQPKWIQISRGTNHSAGITSEGYMWAWGFNSHGQLGIDNESGGIFPTPTRITRATGASTWKYVSCGTHHTIAQQQSGTNGHPTGTLWTWGSNADGQMGVGSSVMNSKAPMRVTFPDYKPRAWMDVSAGSLNTYVIDFYGNFHSCGSNSFGSLGYETENNVKQMTLQEGTLGPETGEAVIPMEPNGILLVNKLLKGIVSSIPLIGSASFITQFSEGLAIEQSNRFYPRTPLLYDAISVSDGKPHIRSTDANINSVSASKTHAIGISRADNKYVWYLGTNSRKEFNTGGPIDLNTNKYGLRTTHQNKSLNVVAAGNYCTFMIYTDGTVYSRGIGEGYRLGNGKLEDVIVSQSEQILDFRNDWSDIQSGGDYGVAVTKTGHIYTWGLESPYNQLGQHPEVKNPTLLPFIFTKPKVYASEDCIYILNGDGIMYAIGLFEIEPGIYMRSSEPIPVKDYRTDKRTGYVPYSPTNGIVLESDDAFNGLYGSENPYRSNYGRYLYQRINSRPTQLLPVNEGPEYSGEDTRTNIMEHYHMYIQHNESTLTVIGVERPRDGMLFSVGEYNSPDSFGIVLNNDKVELYQPLGIIEPTKVFDDITDVTGFVKIKHESVLNPDTGNNEKGFSITFPNSTNRKEIRVNTDIVTIKPGFSHVEIFFAVGSDDYHWFGARSGGQYSLPMTYRHDDSEFDITATDQYYPPGTRAPRYLSINAWYDKAKKQVINLGTSGTGTTQVTLGYTLKFANRGIQFLDGLALPYPFDYSRKENIEYLREKINLFRDINGVPVIEDWTDEVLLSKATPIKAKHVNELNTYVHEVYKAFDAEITIDEVSNQFNNPVVAKNRAYLVFGMIDRLHIVIRALQNK